MSDALATPLLEAAVETDIGETAVWGLVSTQSRLWARLYEDCVALFESARSPRPLMVVPAALVRTVDPPDESLADVVTVRSEFRAYEIRFDSEEMAGRWRQALAEGLSLSRDLPFGGFAPCRAHTPVHFFIDGEEYFAALAAALRSARHCILLAGWQLLPELCLVRSSCPLDDRDRLDRILAERATAGVEVFVLLYGESGIELGSQRAVEHLLALHPDIHALAHSPPIESILYSHHQKLIVVDQRIAFLGGLDVSYGRWDTPGHPVADPCRGSAASIFEGIDYYSPEVAEPDYDALENPLEDMVDRNVHPRMPWHDVACAVEGEAARDVALAFAQRWNEHHFQEDLTPAPIPLQAREVENVTHLDAPLSCQVVRSHASWSGGAYFECSIYAAWLDAIKRAESYLYIEQQFFISGLAGEPVRNRVAEAVFERVAQAIRAGEDFRVYVVLPVHPTGGPGRTAQARALMHWQYQTICRGGGSLLERLAAEFPGVDPERHLAFFALRNHGRVGGRAVTSQVYVHSKLLLADDRVAIIGSANLNDRSLLGDRDSEIGVRLEAPPPASASGGANPVRDFRMRLWNHHLGLQPGSRRIEAPCAHHTWHDTWLARAESNTAIYQEVFPGLPHSSIPTLEALADAEFRPVRIDAASRLQDVRGFVVRYPLGFLRDEYLSTTWFDKEHLLGPELFV